MVNFDLDSARAAPEVLKTVVRAHQNTAGIYAERTAALGEALMSAARRAVDEGRVTSTR